ncbi:MAG TPA: hypothetical protein ENH88_00510 [Pseudoalteromonas prydzensis]|uniref:Phage abortive infection protein n=1 Tax=Pseudoalteromonas prydzensis TaxID=182141 RepID=A0A7V1CVW4_9GAMM|nr:hypothetical protein [Pseudoalteromonas prydzensis]HEA14940.1 hypothetical protein [Pseudoalteromonas prydzensis]
MFTISSKKGITKILCIYIFFLLLIFIVVAYLFFDRFSFDLNSPIENWVNTANYFNSILTPFLLAITSVLIFLTWSTSKKELETTNAALDLDFNFKIFDGMVKSFVNTLDTQVELEFRETAFENAWNYLTKDFPEKIMFVEKIVEQLHPETAKLDLKRTCIKFETTNRECFNSYDLATEVYLIGEDTTVMEIFKPCFENNLFFCYSRETTQSESRVPISIRNFIDILNFIEEHSKDIKDKNKLMNYLVFYIEPRIIKKLSFNDKIKNHPVFPYLPS